MCMVAFPRHVLRATAHVQEVKDLEHDMEQATFELGVSEATRSHSVEPN
jgi:hypothetical protein